MKFDAIGTRWSIETTKLVPPHIKEEILARIELFDKVYSRFRSDSLVRSVATHAGSYSFPNDSEQLVSFYRALYKATDGALTPLVGHTLESLGYDKDYSFYAKSIAPAPIWDETKMAWNGSEVVTTLPYTLDFGAAGKGYLVDIVGEILESYDIREYVIDASGDMLVCGKEEQVGLEDPYNPTRVLGVAQVKNSSICASATNRRRWGEELHHVVDGRTGKPVTEITATWVVADSAMVADGIATALFFTSAEKLLSVSSFQFVRLYSSGKIEHSSNFVGELFI